MLSSGLEEVEEGFVIFAVLVAEHDTFAAGLSVEEALVFTVAAEANCVECNFFSGLVFVLPEVWGWQVDKDRFLCL